MENHRGDGVLRDPARFPTDHCPTFPPPHHPSNYFVELCKHELLYPAGSGTGDGEELKKKPVGKMPLENVVPDGGQARHPQLLLKC